MAAQDGFTPLGGLVAGQHVAAAVTAAQAEAAAGTVLAAVTVPANSVIVDIILTNTDLDTGSAGLVNVGDGTTADAFIANHSIQAAGSVRLSDTDASAVTKVTADTEIEVEIDTSAATGAAGTVTLTVLYFIDG